jgi:hypothetical protein
VVNDADIQKLACLDDGAGDGHIFCIYMENPIDITTQKKLE